MAIAEISVVPLGTGTPSVSKYVARAIEVLQQEKGIRYELSPMGTTIEGDLDKILMAAKKMHEVLFQQGAARVLTMIRIDDRRDKVASMKDKVDSLKRELERRPSQ